MISFDTLCFVILRFLQLRFVFFTYCDVYVAYSYIM
jgi:hypothetical protein